MLQILKKLSLNEDESESINETEDVANEENIEDSIDESIPENGSTSNADDEGKNEHVAPKWLKGKTINNKIRINRLGYYGHILRSDDKGLLKTAMEHKIPMQKKLGRPAFTWRTCIRQDIDRSGIHISDWQAAARNRKAYKAMTKSQYDIMVESEYEEESDIDMDSTGSSLIPSEFEGANGDESLPFDLGMEQEQENENEQQ